MAFTTDNTNGFSNTDLTMMNDALAIRMARGEDEKTAHDAINNAWFEGATADDLI